MQDCSLPHYSAMLSLHKNECPNIWYTQFLQVHIFIIISLNKNIEVNKTNFLNPVKFIIWAVCLVS